MSWSRGAAPGYCPRATPLWAGASMLPCVPSLPRPGMCEDTSLNPAMGGGVVGVHSQSPERLCSGGRGLEKQWALLRKIMLQ